LNTSKLISSTLIQKKYSIKF